MRKPSMSPLPTKRQLKAVLKGFMLTDDEILVQQDGTLHRRLKLDSEADEATITIEVPHGYVSKRKRERYQAVIDYIMEELT